MPAIPGLGINYVEICINHNSRCALLRERGINWAILFKHSDILQRIYVMLCYVMPGLVSTSTSPKMNKYNSLLNFNEFKPGLQKRGMIGRSPADINPKYNEMDTVVFNYLE